MGGPKEAVGKSGRRDQRGRTKNYLGLFRPLTRLGFYAEWNGKTRKGLGKTWT